MALNKNVKYFSDVYKGENDDTANVELKKSGMYGWDSTNLQWKRLSTNTNGNLNSIVKETTPTDATKNNASYVISYNASGDTVRVVMTISSVDYTTNITPQSGDVVITQTKTISIWA
jgi:hypothetical protein